MKICGMNDRTSYFIAQNRTADNITLTMSLETDIHYLTNLIDGPWSMNE